MLSFIKRRECCSCLSFEGRGVLLSFIQRGGDDVLHDAEKAVRWCSLFFERRDAHAFLGGEMVMMFSLIVEKAVR